MSLLVYQLIQDYLPGNRTPTSKGWMKFDSICCHHRGHNQDKRGRGNILFSTTGSIIYNCYNCGFKTGYQGIDITDKFKLFMTYLNIPSDKIDAAKLEIFVKKQKGELQSLQSIELKIESFKEISLPNGSKPIDSYIGSNDELTQVINYINDRGRAISTGYRYYWSPNDKWQLNKRVIIPFLYQDKIIGWTARYIEKSTSEIPRYFTSDVPSGYIFNSDVLFYKNRKYVLICEGPFDAIAINGVGALGSKLNEIQINWLNSFDIEKIIVPDRQRKNQGLIDIALDQGWSVSFPDWENSIKDPAQAIQVYGKLYTIYSIVMSRTSSKLQIDFKRKLLKNG